MKVVFRCEILEFSSFRVWSSFLDARRPFKGSYLDSVGSITPRNTNMSEKTRTLKFHKNYVPVLNFSAKMVFVEVFDI